ncbi:hypothetical protein OAH87_00415 [Marinomonas sp.]|nr:hypothetical protein [Marinomonas sp.]MDB4836916.1 hypothetical protein [Marinomonas sp.]
MIKSIQYKPTGKIVIFSLVLTNVVYAVMLGYTIPMLMEYSSGLPIFDMSPSGYSYEQASILLSNLGEDGRDFYFLQLALDFVYPALFGMSYYFLIQWILYKSAIKNIMWQWVSLLPIVAAGFDYSENINIWIMLSSFPDLPELLVKVASKLTIAKSMLVLSYWVGLLVLILFVLARKFSRRSVDTVS